jgi:hypothetical protein
MLVHFIGGPRHGETEALSGSPTDRIMVPIAPRISYAEARFADPIGPSYALHEYKATRRRRYVIAEYIEPKIDVKWAATITVDPWDSDALRALSQFMWDRRIGEVSSGVRWLSAAAATTGELEITLGIQVDGPPDAGAISDAAEKAQAWLDRRVPKIAKITASAASSY